MFSEDNISIKRLGNGISHMRWDEVLGRKAQRDFALDELIDV
jgi:sialic acid synthase SpsE